jgi:hypothetical protein
VTAYWVRVDLGAKGVWRRVFAGAFDTTASALDYAREMRLESAEARKTPYALLLGRYDAEPEAEQALQHLEAKGWAGYVVGTGAGDYLLFTGAYSTEQGARRQHAILRVEGIDSRPVKR